MIDIIKKQIGHCTLYCADCKDVFPLLESDSIDFIIDDPPYLNLKGGTNRSAFSSKNISAAVGDLWNASVDWIEDAIRISKYAIACWCSDAGLIDTSLEFKDLTMVVLMSWYKRNAPPSVSPYSPRKTNEYCWIYQKRPGIKWGRIKRQTITMKTLRACKPAPNKPPRERILLPNGKAAHPTQKPIELIKKLIACGGNTFGDFHMGLGTTGVAAVKLGKAFIGIERDPRYFEIACERIEQAYKEDANFFPEFIKFQHEKQGWGADLRLLKRDKKLGLQSYLNLVAAKQPTAKKETQKTLVLESSL